MLKTAEDGAFDEMRVPGQQPEADIGSHGKAGKAHRAFADTVDQLRDSIARSVEIRDRQGLGLAMTGQVGSRRNGNR